MTNKKGREQVGGLRNCSRQFIKRHFIELPAAVSSNISTFGRRLFGTKPSVEAVSASYILYTYI